MPFEITNRSMADVSPAKFTDAVPEDVIKIFPYIIPGLNEGEPTLVANGFSVIHIDNTHLNEINPVDETFINGNPYYEAIGEVTANGTLQLVAQTSTAGLELANRKTFRLVINKFEHPQNEKPMIFTVGEPYDQINFENGDQRVYVASNIQFANHYIDPEVTSNLSYEIDHDTLTEITFTDWSVLESQYTNSRAVFTTEGLRAGEYANVEFGTNKEGLINFIKGKASEDAAPDLIRSDVSFVAPEQMIPWKFTPVDLQDKLTMYSDWFDHNNVMWVNEISAMKENGKYVPKKISDIFPDTRVVNLIEDIITVSYLYATNFKDIPRYTADDAKGAAGIRAGQLKAEIQIGHTSLPISDMQSQKSTDVVDTLYETYIRQYPADVNQVQSAQVRTFINAISRYVMTKYATGGGANDYATGLLPWYLEPTSGIAIAPTGNNYAYNPDTEWRVKSQYVNEETLLPLNKLELSNVKEIKADRVFITPHIASTLQAINKIPFPGDIVTSSSSALQYNFYSAYTADVFSKLYLDDVAGTDITVGTPVAVVTPDFSDTFRFDFTKARATTELDTFMVQNFLDNNPTVDAADVHSQGDAHIALTASAKNRYYSATNNVYGSWITGHKTPGGTNTQDANVLLNEMQQTLMTYPGYWRDVVIPWAVAEGVSMKHIYNVPDNEYLIWRLSDPTNNRDAPLADRAKIIAMFAKDDSPLKIWDGTALVNLFDITDIQYLNSGGDSKAIGSVNVVQHIPHIEGNIISNKVIFGVNLHPTERKTVFDKQDWLSHINAVDKTYDNKFTLDGNATPGWSLKELIIGSVWTDEFSIKIGSAPAMIVPSMNKDDETVGIQRILFI